MKFRYWTKKIFLIRIKEMRLSEMKKFFVAFLTVILIFSTGCSESKSVVEENISTEKVVEVNDLKIKIQIGEKVFDATLEDNPSTRELVKNFPLEVKMIELNGNEKYFKFNKNFPSADKNISEIRAGDLMLYSSSYLVLFYKNFSTSYSYTRLGKIDNPADLEKIVGAGNILVKFEK